MPKNKYKFQNITEKKIEINIFDKYLKNFTHIWLFVD